MRTNQKAINNAGQNYLLALTGIKMPIQWGNSREVELLAGSTLAEARKVVSLLKESLPHTDFSIEKDSNRVTFFTFHLNSKKYGACAWVSVKWEPEYKQAVVAIHKGLQ